MQSFHSKHMKRVLTGSIFGAVVGMSCLSADARVQFASPFSNYAVLQRQVAAPIWGEADPGKTVEVSIEKDGQAVFSEKVQADAAGRWEVKTKPMNAGGPYQITASTSAEDAVKITDVLFGDVWLCSGQSNMEMSYNWGLTRGKADMETNSYSTIRLLNVPNKTSITPLKAFHAKWNPCTPETAKHFSACGYFFGVALQQGLQEDIPIGLIDATWSGTYIQTWISLDSLESLPFAEADAKRHRAQVKDWIENDGPAHYDEKVAAWERSLDPLSSGEVKPYEVQFDDSQWKSEQMPTMFEKHISPEFNGTVWYRFRVTLTAEQAAQKARIRLGTVDDEDITYVNGVKVGSLKSWNLDRNYEIPEGTLKAGENVIAVRVYDIWSDGGMSAPADHLYLLVGEEKVTLAGVWRYHATMRTQERPVNLRFMPANTFAACYEGMLRPLFPLAIKGAIWYQGCSNVGKHEAYDGFFRKMAEDWRSNFSGGAFPIYMVQLAAFMGTHLEPFESNWAAMRWVQMQLGESLENCGTAVTIDVGDHADIHPKDKKTVGERLARLALNRTYGKKQVVEAGPIPQEAKAVAGGVEIRFLHAKGLKTSETGAQLKGFQIANAEGVYSWAEATIVGETVLVKVPEGVQATAVRFAWDDYPECNLVNGEGLPCGPFAYSLK